MGASLTLIDVFGKGKGFGSTHGLGKGVDVLRVMTDLGREFGRFWDLLVQWGSIQTAWEVISKIFTTKSILTTVKVFSSFAKQVFVKETFISGAKLASNMLSKLGKAIVPVGKMNVFGSVQNMAVELYSSLNTYASCLGVITPTVGVTVGGLTLIAFASLIFAWYLSQNCGKARLGTSNENLDACKKQLDAYAASLLRFLENMSEAGMKEFEDQTENAEKYLVEAINKLPPPVPEDKTKYRLLVLGRQGGGKSTICNAILRYPEDRRIPTTETETKTPCPITLAGSLRLDPGCHVELSECTLSESIGEWDLLLGRALRSFHGVILVHRGRGADFKNLIRNIRMWKKDLIVVQNYLDNEELHTELDEEEQLNEKAEEMVAKTKEIIREIDPSWKDPDVFAVSGREEYKKRCGKGSGYGYQFNAMESLMFDMARRKTAEWQEKEAE